MCCSMGRKVQYYCPRRAVRSHDVISSSKQRKLLTDEDMDTRARMIPQLAMITDGLLGLSCT